jgi:hypothetical protein
MQIFKCAHCGQLVYFENTYCERCGHLFGFDKELMTLCTLVPSSNENFYIYNGAGKEYKYCINHTHGVCNWLVEAESEDIYCAACEPNRMIPDLTNPVHVEEWAKLEKAKHRLIYTLLRLGLPIVSKDREPATGLAFNFLADIDINTRVLTGHEEGLITINAEEADDLVRERVRHQMGEPYRTLLGHFRHEVGHYYWSRLIQNSNHLYEFRNIFGDEQADYKIALEKYYEHGAPANWQQHHISAYASSHPWEDWAESWAHYLHMMDTLETAWSFGLNVSPMIAHSSPELVATMDVDPYYLQNFNDIIGRWLPFTYAMNSINRSMGHVDLYPFVMSSEVINKLAFIHKVCREGLHQA